jgi:hypothetical protein
MFTEDLRAQFGNDALLQSQAHEQRTAFKDSDNAVLATSNSQYWDHSQR